MMAESFDTSNEFLGNCNQSDAHVIMRQSDKRNQYIFSEKIAQFDILYKVYLS